MEKGIFVLSARPILSEDPPSNPTTTPPPLSSCCRSFAVDPFSSRHGSSSPSLSFSLLNPFSVYTGENPVEKTGSSNILFRIRYSQNLIFSSLFIYFDLFKQGF
ncbi:hypothetical protein P8452_03179 [Trifolium repens]|nr:hypothetical protein P8452_03179 [Trifolium repens]